MYLNRKIPPKQCKMYNVQWIMHLNGKILSKNFGKANKTHRHEVAIPQFLIMHYELWIKKVTNV
jgi:hypothetical protein